jgi:hypothetical protein
MAVRHDRVQCSKSPREKFSEEGARARSELRPGLDVSGVSRIVFQKRLFGENRETRESGGRAPVRPHAAAKGSTLRKG